MDIANFLYIGLSKSASTYIYQICKEHPEIYVPIIKDIFFFDKEYSRGLDWYKKFFKNSGSAIAIGEISHDYLFSPEACNRIKQDIPKVKLIICLREPLDWLVSKKNYEEGRKNLNSSSFIDFAKSPLAAKEMQLSQNLQRYFDQFPPEQILILFYDDLKTNPQTCCQKIYSFLEVNDQFKPPSLKKKILVSQKPRLKIIAVLAQSFCDLCRQFGWQKLLGFLKNQQYLDNFIFSSEDKQNMIAENEKKALVDYYRPELIGLMNLGLDLPQSWLRIYNLEERK